MIKYFTLWVWEQDKKVWVNTDVDVEIEEDVIGYYDDEAKSQVTTAVNRALDKCNFSTLNNNNQRYLWSYTDRSIMIEDTLCDKQYVLLLNGIVMMQEFKGDKYMVICEQHGGYICDIIVTHGRFLEDTLKDAVVKFSIIGYNTEIVRNDNAPERFIAGLHIFTANTDNGEVTFKVKKYER